MTIEQIETEFLALSKDSQVTLLARLLEYVGGTDIDQEVAEVWAEEADFRNQAMDKGQVFDSSAEEVFQRTRASLS